MTTAESFLAEQARHFAAVDPLLPDPALPTGGEAIGAVAADGRPLLAMLRHETNPPGMISSLWSARVVQQLHPLVTASADLEPLLTRWHTLLADRDDPGDDSACVLTWPSRDTTASGVLLRHGFVPLTVLAVRTGTASAAADPTPAALLRDATPADLPELVRLALIELSYSADVGAAVVREDAAEMKESSLRWWLDGRSPTLLAEAAGTAVGMVQYRATTLDAEAMPRLLRPGRWAYVNCLSVLPAARSSGVGRALMNLAHARLAAAGVTHSYLYYNPANPLSSVFWPRQGYRPLWTVWEARPARALR